MGVCAGCAVSATIAGVMWTSGKVISWVANYRRTRAMAAVEAEYDAPAMTLRAKALSDSATTSQPRLRDHVSATA